jgi:fatty-acyl-CoA synthase
VSSKICEPASALRSPVLTRVARLKGPTHAPKHVEFVEALPMTSVRKIDKKILKAKFWAGQQRMVG